MKTKWKIDPAHSRIEFKIRHLMITTVTGSFQEFDADIEAEENDFSKAQILFSANAGSLTTGSADRDKHLRSADFFDVEKHPKLIFRSTSVNQAGKNIYELKGELTIRGITRHVVLKAGFDGMMRDPWGKVKAGFTVTGKINRKDFGVSWNAPLEAGGLLVGDEVLLNCEVQLVQMENKTTAEKQEVAEEVFED